MRIRPLGETRYDLLVVGGGINGAGIAREAARRGWGVALVEKQDYGAGTTSRSTRLIHGGLRYLEHGELALVLESLRERERLLRRQPHLARPLRFVIPIYDGSSRSPLLIRAGMLLYDLLSAGKSLPRHRLARAAELHELQARLSAPGVKAAFLYFDGQVNFPERLVMETLAEARRHGAVTFNHCELLSFLRAGRAVEGACVRDTISGQECLVAARMTVNVTGPWLEQLHALLPTRRAHPLLAPTRGTHLVVPCFPGAAPDALYFEAASDRRPVFVIPWNGAYLIGTTDLPFSGDPSHIRPLPEEVDYLLAEVNGVIRGARLTRASVMFAYSGVRALPFEEALPPGELTRRHILFDHQRQDGISGLMSVLGGKLTTYRVLSRDVAGAIGHRLGVPRPPAEVEEPPDFTLWPWRDGSRQELERAAAPLAAHFMTAPAEVVRLFETYGEAGEEILRLAAGNGELRRPIEGGEGAIAAEVIHAVRHEQALSVADVLLRRTCIALSAGRGLAAAPAVADLLSRELGWDTRQRNAAIDAYAEEVERALPQVQ
jgi:glycerol-3-phosphate dehydrogenase